MTCVTGHGSGYAGDALRASSATVFGDGWAGGTVDAPASKSFMHRALICSALYGGAGVAGRTTMGGRTTVAGRMGGIDGSDGIGGTRLVGEGDSLDIRVTRECLGRLLGDGPDVACGSLLLDCGESGSTLRFLLPVAAALGKRCGFDGRGRLPARPLGALLRLLGEHGVEVGGDGEWPVRIGGRLHGGEFALPGNVSSQYASGLLMALPLTAEGGTVRVAPPVESLPYIDLTCDVLSRFGIGVGVEVRESGERVYSVEPASERHRGGPDVLEVEGDWSGAAFWLCAGAIAASGVSVRGLDPRSRQGDRAILDILGAFGADAGFDVRGGCASAGRGAGRLHGIELDVSDTPDLVPALGVVAACACGTTALRGAGRLRLKESDRLHGTAMLARLFGAEAEELEDAIIIRGVGCETAGACVLQPATVDPRGDHRMAMAATVGALRSGGPVTVLQPGCVAKSYPGFFDDFASLGGRAVFGCERPTSQERF